MGGESLAMQALCWHILQTGMRAIFHFIWALFHLYKIYYLSRGFLLVLDISKVNMVLSEPLSHSFT